MLAWDPTHSDCSTPIREKLKSENTTRTFVQSRSSMGESSVGSTHSALFSKREHEREREGDRGNMCYLTPRFCSLSVPPRRAEPSNSNRFLLIQVREELLNQPMMSPDYMSAKWLTTPGAHINNSGRQTVPELLWMME